MRLKLAFIAAALLAALTIGCSKSEPAPAASTSSPSTPAVAAPAKKAPDFKVTALDGKPYNLADLKGKVVLVDFWATWCPPCQASIPHLDAMQKKYGDKGLIVLGLSFDQDKKDLAEFVRAKKIGYAIAQAPEDTSKAYNVSSIPRMFVIDREGNIKGDFLGFSDQIGKNIESATELALSR